MCGDSCDVSRGKSTLILGRKRGNLYHLQLKTVVSEAHISENADPEQDLNLWHSRLGHVNHEAVRKVLKLRKADLSQRTFCRGCALGKLHRTSFPQKDGGKKKEVRPGALIHADLCGKMNPPSIGGSVYFLLIKDDATNFQFVYFLKDKSGDTLRKTFEKFAMEWKSLSSEKITRLRTDWGTEFVNQYLGPWLHGEKILHEKSFPYCPEMNGFIERSNRTVVESARSMLHGAGLKLGLWAEAVQTAVYILNRIPSRALNDATPHEMLTGDVPILHHIRVFGSPCFPVCRRGKENENDAESKRRIHPDWLSSGRCWWIQALQQGHRKCHV